MGERRFSLSLSLFIASLFPLPPETLENSGYFFTMGCSSTLPKGVGKSRFLSLSLWLLSSPFPQKRLRNRGIFSRWGALLFFLRGWKRENSPSLSLSLLSSPFPQKHLRTQAIFSTMGYSSLQNPPLSSG